MEIKYYGQSCFVINANNISIAIDPYQEQWGLKKLKLSADIVLITHDHADHNNAEAVSLKSSKPDIINNPGEYEIKGVFIEGIDSYHDEEKGKTRGQNTIYTINLEKIKICHLGDLGQPELIDQQLERIGEVDVLMVPVGGNFTIDAVGATKVINQIEPKIVIPMHYKMGGVDLDIAPVEEFLKQEGESVEPIDSLKISEKDLLSEGTKILVLKS